MSKKQKEKERKLKKKEQEKLEKAQANSMFGKDKEARQKGGAKSGGGSHAK